MIVPPIGFATAEDDTKAGFEHTTQQGAAGVAGTVWSTADGLAVLDHDGRVGSRFRRRSVRRFDRAALPEQTLSLADLYEIVGTGVPISLDVRDVAAFDSVLDTARSAGASAESNLWLCHAELDQLTEWRPQTSARLVLSTSLKGTAARAERLAADLQQRSVDGLSLFHREWSGGSIALLHRFERLALASGTIYEREVATVVDAGIDGVYSDHVDRMMAVIAQYYGGDRRDD